MNSSLSLSLELMYLLAWLLKNEQHMLNDLVKEAIKNGLVHDINRLDQEDPAQVAENLETTILDFLVFLEDSLHENLKKLPALNKTEKNIAPTLKKIEAYGISPHALHSSIKQTKAKIAQEKKTPNEAEHAKQILLKQILKNWKPSSKEILN